MTRARVAPLEPPYSETVAAALARVMPAGVPPLALFRTVAVNERVFLRLMAGGLLDRGSISLRERELVVDRTCARCGSEYEWGVHVAFFAERVGLSPAQVAATAGADHSALPERERLLLRLADELHERAQVSDALWEALREHWSDEQLIELVALAGFYHLISFLTNALRIPAETYGARFPGASARSGAGDTRSAPVSPQAGS
jgi:alkylhydroperoxidase family enzyme